LDTSYPWENNKTKTLLKKETVNKNNKNKKQKKVHPKI
jgi:hypothetical protein